MAYRPTARPRSWRVLAPSSTPKSRMPRPDSLETLGDGVHHLAVIRRQLHGWISEARLDAGDGAIVILNLELGELQTGGRGDAHHTLAALDRAGFDQLLEHGQA